MAEPEPRRKIPRWQIGFFVVLLAFVFFGGGRRACSFTQPKLHVRCELHGHGDAAQVRCAVTNRGRSSGRVDTNIVLHCSDGQHRTLLRSRSVRRGEVEVVVLRGINPPLTEDSLDCESELTGWKWRDSGRHRLTVQN